MVPPRTPLSGANLTLADGSVFSLAAYQRSREDMTEEFSSLVPAMQRFVADWKRAHDPNTVHKQALTAKSYLPGS